MQILYVIQPNTWILIWSISRTFSILVLLETFDIRLIFTASFNKLNFNKKWWYYATIGQIKYLWISTIFQLHSYEHFRITFRPKLAQIYKPENSWFWFYKTNLYLMYKSRFCRISCWILAEKSGFDPIGLFKNWIIVS